MGKTLTSEERRLELINDMGEELGTVFYHLSNRLMECFFLWKDFKYLFVEENGRVDILNNSAPLFFANVQRIFRDKVVLDLSKLADPAFDNRGNENVTYARIIELVDKDLSEELDAKNKQLGELIGELKHHRNKRIGHNDLTVAEMIRKSELPSINSDTIDKVFLCIQEQFNMIINHYQGATTPFHFLEEHPSTRGLLYVLYDGLESRKKRQERFRNRTHNEDDLNRRKLRL